MKENLLTLMVVFLFLLVGTFVVKAEIRTDTPITNISLTGKNFVEIKIYLKSLSKECENVGGLCNYYLETSEIALNSANSICESRGWGSGECAMAVDNATLSVYDAIYYCENENSIAKIKKHQIRQRKNFIFTGKSELVS